jgi:hypothetical protein|uniref:Uncharacterized protein n=1 Tax=viral metagenome TaxID=1070528 RepID=A0A6C0KLX4_9ZZZZ
MSDMALAFFLILAIVVGVLTLFRRNWRQPYYTGFTNPNHSANSMRNAIHS